MTDKPSAETSGDAEFQRWFAEQDPFGNTKPVQQTKQAENAPKRSPASWLFRFGVALPAAIFVLAVLTLAFVAGSMMGRMH